MSGAYPYRPRPRSPSYARRSERLPVRRSHAAAPLAVVVLLVGLILGTWSILVPLLLGLLLLSVGGTFLSSRLNPFSVGFYLTTKPSWSAIGVVVLSGVLLLAAAWAYWAHGLAGILPGVRGLVP